MRLKTHCVLGGTFTYVHAGHQKLLDEAAKYSRITIGLTSDEYVKKHKIYPSFPFKRRLEGLKAALERKGIMGRAEIVKIDDEVGNADRLEDADAIIVSQETKPAAEKINLARKKRGLPPLRIISVPIVYAEDLQKLSCERIYAGKTDLEGRLAKPLKVQLASANPTKREGAEAALRCVFGKKFSLRFHAEDSRVAAHPFNEETFLGAKNRAHAAWARANSGKGGCDYALGIESGLFSRMGKGMHIDITVCCVYDGKRDYFGTGMGFVVPERIARRIIAKRSDLSEALAEISGIEKIGWREGALGWFSAGMMHRKEQIEAAVKCAFVPLISRAKRGIEY